MSGALPTRAAWIDHPDAPAGRDLACRFRREVVVSDPAAWRRVLVSADSSYRLLLQGEVVARGPERGTWRARHVDELDLSARVKRGQRVVLVAEVVRWGPGGPVYDQSRRLGFLLECDDVATDASWSARLDPGFNPDGAPEFPRVAHVAGNWMEHRDTRSEGAAWTAARELTRANDAASPWPLAPRSVPPLVVGEERSLRVVQSGVVEAAAPAPPFGYATVAAPGAVPRLPLELDGGARVRYLVFDLGRVTNGYPRVTFEAEAGALVELMYAEATSLNGWKGRRDDLDTRRIEGYRDELVARGGVQTFEPHGRRTFRYLRLAVRSRGRFVLRAVSFAEVSHPLGELATFSCSDPMLEQVWQVGVDTWRACALDRYEDSPYYERLQYAGDARIQALVGYVVAGETRLAEKAVVELAESRTPSGFLQARYPAREPQVIPSFSHLWVEMCEELHLYTGREERVRELLPLVREVLDAFRPYEDADGCLRDLPMWNFLDWTFPDKGMRRNPGDVDAPMTMFHVGGLRAAARLHGRLGEGEHASALARRADRTAAAVRRQTWSAREGAFLDGVVRRTLSKHTNALALQHGLLDGPEADALAERLLADDALPDTTFYFDFYLHRALERLGRGDLLLAHLARWDRMLTLGATTWFESQEPSRSDCHAWSASPTFDLSTTILGVRVLEPGFRKVAIDPHPGHLEWAKGTVPTPHGPIEVEWRRGVRRLELEVHLPDGVERVE